LDQFWNAQSSIGQSVFLRGPLVVTSIEPGRKLKIVDGPPWEADSRRRVVVGTRSSVELRLTAAQALALPDEEEGCLVNGYYLDDEPQVEDEENELRWGQHRRAFGARLDA
jgi:hypothetical protein